MQYCKIAQKLNIFLYKWIFYRKIMEFEVSFRKQRGVGEGIYIILRKKTEVACGARRWRCRLHLIRHPPAVILSVVEGSRALDTFP